MPRLFLDTEFTGLHQDARLLSLALVPERGPWFYAVFTDVATDALGDWHRENVVPHLLLTEQQQTTLPEGQYVTGGREKVIVALKGYLSSFDRIMVWADVPAYDWVFFCELFGGALSLPKNVHYIVRDLATLLETKGYDIDTDRLSLAYGKGADAGAVRSGDGRGETETTATGRDPWGLSRHNALGDAQGGREVWLKINGQ